MFQGRGSGVGLLESRAEEEISDLNSMRGMGTEVRETAGHGDSTLDLFHYGNAIGL